MAEEGTSNKGVESTNTEILRYSEGRTLPVIKVEIKPPPVKPPKQDKK
jgi:hypothetical protein